MGEDDEVAGRLVWTTSATTAGRPNVVVDARTMSWEEPGMALEPYEGWGFLLVIEDRVHDLRSDAEVIELRGPGAGQVDA